MSHPTFWRTLLTRLTGRAAHTGEACATPAIQIQAGRNVVITEPVVLRIPRAAAAAPSTPSAAASATPAEIMAAPLPERDRLALCALAWMMTRTDPERQACAALLRRKFPGIEANIAEAAGAVGAFGNVLQEYLQAEAEAVQTELAAAKQRVDATCETAGAC